MQEQTTLPFLDKIYEDPWIIRRFRSHFSLPEGPESERELSAMFIQYYERRTGDTRPNLELAQFPERLPVLDEIPRGQVSFPAYECITSEKPSALAARASKSFATPALALCEAKNCVYSVNYSLPIVTESQENGFLIHPEISSPYSYALSIRGGKRVVESNNISLSGVFAFGDHFGGNNFAHWLMDWVPRFYFLRQSLKDDRRLSLIFGARLNRVQRQTLDKLGVGGDRIIALHPETALSPISFRVERLVAPTSVGKDLRRPFQFCSPWAIEFVRSLFLDPSKMTRRKRIIINRKGTRRLIIDEMGKALLSRFHFEEVFPEDLSVTDQAALFASSEIIISAHGAGLSNLVFCSPGTAVFEIFPQDYSTSNFFALASAVGCSYCCAVGRSSKNPLGSHLRDYDIVVDGALLDKFISQFGR